MRKDIQLLVKNFLDNPDAIDNIQDVKSRTKLGQLKDAPSSQGRDFLIAHYLGIELSRTEAVKAFCCECSGYYTDKRCDCEVEGCVLYRWMPYGTKKKRSIRKDKKCSHSHTHIENITSGSVCDDCGEEI